MRSNARVSRLVFWALFATLLISSSGIVCLRPGDTRLSSLELVVQNVNRLVFDPMLRVYDVWLPAGETQATVRAVPMDPLARVTWYVPDGDGMLASGVIGVGGGEVTVDLPPDGYSLYIGVFPPEGGRDTYIVNMNPLCPQGDPCHNGGVPGTCSGDVCVTSCVPTDEVCDDGIDNDCDGPVDLDDDDCTTVEAGGDQAVDEGVSVQLFGEVRCACDYQWDFGDGTAPETGTLTPTHVYADDGFYQVTLTMTPAGGPSYSDALDVMVQNVVPTLSAGLDVSGNQVTVVGTFNDPGTLDTHVASIDWGDGQVSAATVTESPFGPPGATSGMDGSFTGNHVYTNGGTYTVTVAVADDDGAAVSDTLVANVVPTCPLVPDFDEVDWQITADAMAPMEGTIDTSAPGSYGGVAVFGLPPSIGPDYTIEMDATTPDGETNCIGFADFGTAAAETTEILVSLQCAEPNGACTLEDAFLLRASSPREAGNDGCSRLIRAVVSPLQTSIGNQIDLSSQAQDPEGDSIEYSWTGTGGSIDDPTAPETTYTCVEVGDQLITITVSDDGFTSCVDDWTFAVTCVSGD